MAAFGADGEEFAGHQCITSGCDGFGPMAGETRVNRWGRSDRHESLSDSQIDSVGHRNTRLPLKTGARVKIQVDEFAPGVPLGVVHCVHPVDAANVRSVFVNGARLGVGYKVSARSIATIQKPGFVGDMNTLAAQTASGTGE